MRWAGLKNAEKQAAFLFGWTEGVRKSAFLAGMRCCFFVKKRSFVKTGSGQTEGKVERNAAVLSVCLSPLWMDQRSLELIAGGRWCGAQRDIEGYE
jgi:hypothetical protein